MPSLKFIRGPEGSSHHPLEVESRGRNERLALITIDSANEGALYDLVNCPSFQLVSCREGSGADYRRTSPQDFFALRHTKDVVLASVRLEDFFGPFTIEDTEADYSKCKAQVSWLLAAGYSVKGLASVRSIDLRDAQHIRHFISALFKAQPESLSQFNIECKKSGDCGCEQNAPHFTPLLFCPPPDDDDEDLFCGFSYNCPQVKDLASLAQWNSLTDLELKGCKSVEVWPDFTAMTSLETLSLRKTSLKEWPAAVLALPHLKKLDLSGCRDLPAKDLIMNGAVAVPESMTVAHWTCRGCSLASLRRDLREGTRDRGSVADALGALSPELVLLFNRGLSSNFIDACRLLILQKLVVEIMHVVWFGHRHDEEEWCFTYNDGSTRENGVGSVVTDQVEWQHIREKMRGLLCCESFLMLPFLAYNFLLHSKSARNEQTFGLEPRQWYSIAVRGEEEYVVWVCAGIAALGIPLVGGGAMSFECCRASLNKKWVLNFVRSSLKDEWFHRMMQLKRVRDAARRIAVLIQNGWSRELTFPSYKSR